MDGALVNYGLDILFTGGALLLFLVLWWRGRLDWSEKPCDILFMEDQDGK
jgi:hypothetical protein